MLEGVFCPSVTILDDNYNIDYKMWGKHLDHLVDAGISGILLFGSIGEFYAVSTEEKKKAIKFAKDRIGNKTKLFFGVADVVYKNVLDLACYGQEVGVDALFIVSPYYFGPTDKTAIEYYSGVAKIVDTPIFLYNFPDRTGTDLSPELVAKIVGMHSNVCGIKDTVDTISHTRKVLTCARAVNPNFSVISGYDEYYMVNRISGGNGVLCGLTNIVPEIFVKMHTSYQSGDFKTAIECAKKISKLMFVYDQSDLFISAIKAGVKVNGLNISTNVFEPAVQITDQQYKKIESMLK